MKRWGIVIILLVAAFLRLYMLSSVPPSASLDEASIGYNAYSFLHTGKDEYGTVFPILLRAYDDYRPALYVYLVMPFVALFGLTVMAVRLPSVILSITTVYLVYCTGKLLGKKFLSFPYLGELAAGLLAISPWHIYISRLGHEANLGLFLTVCAVYFFFSAMIRRRNSDFFVSAIFFGLSVYGYQSEKAIVPLLLIAGAVLFWKQVWQKKIAAVAAAVLCGMIVLPALVVTLSPQGMLRFRGTSAFSADSAPFAAAAKRYEAAKAAGNRLGEIMNGKYVTSVTVFADNYLSHFSPVWLFWGGNREDFKAPGVGLLYTWEMVFVLLGFWTVWKFFPKRYSLFLYAVILASPVPAAITTGSPHAMRIYTMLSALPVIEAAGFWYVIRRIPLRYARTSAVIFAVIIALGFTGFWHGYFVRFPAEQSDAFQYAMRGAVAYAQKNGPSYARVDFANQGALYQSYMFFLFYTKYDPALYQREGGTVSGGFAEAHHFGKYAFGYLPRTPSGFTKDTLYYYNADEVPEGLRVVARFSDLDGKPAIVAAAL